MARICVIRQYRFPGDVRVAREVQALIMAGHEVDVICITQPNQPTFQRDGAVTIFRLPPEHRRAGPARYFFEYGCFFLGAMLLASALHLRRRYDLIQVHSVPDALVFAAIVPRLLGARVLLDLQESMPEFFSTKFKTDLNHPGVRFVAWLEQASIRFANAVITCTDQMREAFVARGANGSKIGVVLNSADEAIFDVQAHPPRPGSSGGFVLVCHGLVEERYGLDTIIRAVSLLREELPDLRFHVYGGGPDLERLKLLATRLGVGDRVRFMGYVPIEELLEGIAAADVGVVAMKRDAFRDLTHCNKMFDFISMRVPVIMSRTHSVQAYFPESCFAYFDSDDEHSLAQTIRELHSSPDTRQRLVEQALRVNEPYRWPKQREVYLTIIRGLIDTRTGARQRAHLVERTRT